MEPAAGGGETSAPLAEAARLRARRRGLIGAGLVVVVAVVAIAGVLGVRSSSQVSEDQLTEDQLRVGDCLTGSNLGLNTSNPWPFMVAAVPCTQQHTAEVFFAGNVWPQSAPYPGDNAISGQGAARCQSAFQAYVGIGYSDSKFSYTFITPSGGDDWASGDRLLVCVAYDEDPSIPSGAFAIKYSIKGSDQ
jgi:hypothetical protein